MYSKKLLSSLLIVCLMFGHFTSLQSDAVSASPSNDRVLGTNIGSIVDWSSAIMFQDAFKTARKWIPQSNSVWDTGEYDLLDLDSNGWVKSLPASDSSLVYRKVTTLLFQSLDGHYPTGQYTVLYDGEGTITYFNAGCYPNSDCAHKNTALSGTGRDIVDVDRTNEYGIQITIASTDPNKTGNYLRNIRIILPGYENSYQTDTFDPAFIDHLKPYGVLRFMETTRTNNSTEHAWQDRAKPTDYVWSTDKGIPIETLVTMSNRVNADPWVNVPHLADDDYMQKMAEYMKAHVTPNRKIYVEYSNEVWNGMFAQKAYAEAQWALLFTGSADPYTKLLNFQGKRTAEMCKIWKDVFWEDKGRIVCTVGVMPGNVYSTRALLDCPLWSAVNGGKTCQSYGIDAVAVAPYFGYYLGASYYDQTKTWYTGSTGWLAAGLDTLFAEIGTGGQLVSNTGDTSIASGALMSALNDIDSLSAETASRGLSLVAYEWWQHLTGVGNAINDANLTELFTEANRDSRMGTIYTKYLDEWKKRWGGLFMHFSLLGRYSRYGSWGSLEYQDQTTGPKHDAIMNFAHNTACWYSGCNTTPADSVYTPPVVAPVPVPAPIPAPSIGGGGGGGSMSVDYCPNGDTSNSYYDGKCSTKPFASWSISITDPKSSPKTTSEPTVNAPTPIFSFHSPLLNTSGLSKDAKDYIRISLIKTINDRIERKTTNDPMLRVRYYVAVERYVYQKQLRSKNIKEKLVFKYLREEFQKKQGR